MIDLTRLAPLFIMANNNLVLFCMIDFSLIGWEFGLLFRMYDAGFFNLHTIEEITKFAF